MNGYRDSCPKELEGFRREVMWLIVRLMQCLEDQFKEEVKVVLSFIRETHTSAFICFL